MTLDCGDPLAVARFWSYALGRPVDEGASQCFASIGRGAEVARLLGLGAQHVGDYDEWGARWTTPRDVEGNEFCVSAG